MEIGAIIQNFATGSAVALGAIYIIGGLIVNLNLTRRGIIEYQVVKVKYLAVGLIFMVQFFGVLLFTSLLLAAIILLTFNLVSTETSYQVTSVLSIVSSIMLLAVWSRYPPNTQSVVGKWSFWFAFSSFSTLFPLYLAITKFFKPETPLEQIPVVFLGILTFALAILAQIYHYSSFYYGRPSLTGALDPIGMGIPTRVEMLCDKSISSSLRELGLTVRKNIIMDIYLVDETNEHYIVSQEQVPSGTGENKSYKVNKELVKIILHKPDHMRKLSDTNRSQV